MISLGGIFFCDITWWDCPDITRWYIVILFVEETCNFKKPTNRSHPVKNKNKNIGTTKQVQQEYHNMFTYNVT